MLDKKLTYIDISKRVGCARSTVRDYSKKLGYYTGSNKRHTLDITYFREINTSEKAYILGLLYADGCNTRKGLYLALVEEDKEVIDFVKTELKASNDLRFVKAARKTWKNKYELSIKSIELSKSLTEVGIHPAKSFTITFPFWLNDSLLPHFIRGFFDGDGHIAYDGKNCRIGFVSGSTTFIEDLYTFLDKTLGIKLPMYINKNCKSLQSSKQPDIEVLLTYLYSNSSFSMKRKREKANAFLERRGGI